MLEIFAFPYFVVSGVIGWIIYKPFFRSVEFEPLSPDQAHRNRSSRHLATGWTCFLVFQLVSAARKNDPLRSIGSDFIGSLIALTSLAIGMFLTPRTSNPTFAKRMVLVGVVGPLAFSWRLAGSVY